jgi:hypothetical protein
MRIFSTSLAFQEGSAAAALGRKLATVLVFVALLLQGYIAQTHIHMGPVSAATWHAEQKAHPSPGLPGKSDERANCPLCQAALDAGAALPPLVLDFLIHRPPGDLLPLQAVRDMRTAAHGHREKQRGPPLS